MCVCDIFLHLPVNEHVGCFHFLSIVNSAAMNPGHSLKLRLCLRKTRISSFPLCLMWLDHQSTKHLRVKTSWKGEGMGNKDKASRLRAGLRSHRELGSIWFLFLLALQPQADYWASHWISRHISTSHQYITQVTGARRYSYIGQSGRLGLTRDLWIMIKHLGFTETGGVSKTRDL